MKPELNVKVRESVKPRMSMKPVKDGEKLKEPDRKKAIFFLDFPSPKEMLTQRT